MPVERKSRQIRLPAELDEAIVQAAAQHGRSVNNWIIWALTERLNPEVPAPATRAPLRRDASYDEIMGRVPFHPDNPDRSLARESVNPIPKRKGK
jgi:hypothetical protein